MASRTIVHLVDDLDGGEADETIRFALDGVEYEIDLSKENAEEFRDAMHAYATRARRRAGVIGRPRRRSTSSAPPELSLSDRRAYLDQVRTWANENGYTVADRGRIARAVVEAYEAAH